MISGTDDRAAGTPGVEDFAPSAKVIADSISTEGIRVTTLEVRLHRFMHSELNTHRAFSRNSASSRAIPVAKQIARLLDEPVLPLMWPAERKGMQGGAPLPSNKAFAARQTWLRARDEAVACANTLADIGVHKSVVNRLLEPFMSHTVIITATDWSDFFAQRKMPQDGSEPLAQAEIVIAAEAIYTAREESTPEKLTLGQWHLPYIADWELKSMPMVQARKVSVARCARVSYLTQDGVRSPQADLDLYQRLRTANPPHWSPLEHVCTPATADEPVKGNLTGWHQLRHLRGDQ